MSALRVFIDTDVFLDVMADRPPHGDYAAEVIGLCESNELKGYTSSLVLANLFYIVRKISSSKKAVEGIEKIRSIITVLPFTDKEIGESLQAGFKDFEDGVQYFIAVNHGVTMFITRNIKDYKKASMSVLTPQDFLRTRQK